MIDTLITVLVFSVGFPILFALRNHQQFLERNKYSGWTTPNQEWRKHNRNWHFIQAAIQAWIGALIAVFLLLTGATWLDVGLGVLTYAFAFWLIFDSITGWKMKNDPFFLGNTAFLDRLLSKTLGRIGSFIAKLLILIGLILIWMLL